ncbi:MAG: L-threonylcarbamoyladenylate synthase [Muribaculaceae bacterium]
MKMLKIYPGSINSRFIDEAVEVICDGGIVIYPTDTLYALGCDALNNKAVEKLCRLKGINPDKQQLSVVCASLSQAAEYAKIDNRAFAYLKEYLPGPFTFILPASSALPKVFKGRKTVGIRIPDNPITLALTEAAGGPLLSTSVAVDSDIYNNVDPEAIAVAYNNMADLIIDGGESIAEGSTVVSLLDSASPEIIREGKGVFED